MSLKGMNEPLCLRGLITQTLLAGGWRTRDWAWTRRVSILSKINIMSRHWAGA